MKIMAVSLQDTKHPKMSSSGIVLVHVLMVTQGLEGQGVPPPPPAPSIELFDVRMGNFEYCNVPSSQSCLLSRASSNCRLQFDISQRKHRKSTWTKDDNRRIRSDLTVCYP